MAVWTVSRTRSHRAIRPDKNLYACRRKKDKDPDRLRLLEEALTSLDKDREFLTRAASSPTTGSMPSSPEDGQKSTRFA